MRKHIEVIDVLRGLAALEIALFHVRVDLWTGWSSAIGSQSSLFDRAAALLSLPTPFFGGGVMLFFVVSGFCIHYPYAMRRDRFHPLSFAFRRFFRIYPPYFAAIALTIVVELVVQRILPADTLDVRAALRSLLMIQNYPPAPGQLSANPSLWSIPVEVELYLIYALLMLAGLRMRRRGLFPAIAAVSISAGVGDVLGVRWLAGNAAEYWIIWCSGASLAEQVATGKLPSCSGRRTAAGVAILISSCAAVLLHVPTILQNWLWGGFFFMVLAWGLAEGRFQAFAHSTLWSGAIKLGSISYSLYLIHFPFFKLSGALWVNRFGQKPGNFVISLGFVAAAILLAWAFYLLVELPSHRLARRCVGHAKINLAAT